MVVTMKEKILVLVVVTLLYFPDILLHMSRFHHSGGINTTTMLKAYALQTQLGYALNL